MGLPRWSEARCRQVLRDHPGAETDWIIVARRDRGWVGISVAHRLGTDGYAFFTGVAPDFRGMALGRTLKGELIRRLRAHGIGTLRTNNLDRNLAAITMNEALGFQPVPGRLELRAHIAPERHLTRDSATSRRGEWSEGAESERLNADVLTRRRKDAEGVVATPDGRSAPKR